MKTYLHQLKMDLMINVATQCNGKPFQIILTIYGENTRGMLCYVCVLAIHQQSNTYICNMQYFKMSASKPWDRIFLKKYKILIKSKISSIFSKAVRKNYKRLGP